MVFLWGHVNLVRAKSTGCANYEETEPPMCPGGAGGAKREVSSQPLHVAAIRT
jgi:hypothetical protein